MLPKQKHYHKPASQCQPRMYDVIPQEPGLPDTANIPGPCCPSLPPGSLFIWGHRNVNSLSLSISEKITVGPKLPHKEVAGQRRAEHNSKARGAWSLKASLIIGVCVLLWTRWMVVMALWGSCIVVGCVRLFDSSGMSVMNYIQLLIRDSKKCLWKIHFHSRSPEHRQRVLFLKHIQWQRTLQSFT